MGTQKWDMHERSYIQRREEQRSEHSNKKIMKNRQKKQGRRAWEDQGRTHSGSQAKIELQEEQSSTKSNSAYRSCKMRMKEDNWLDLTKWKSLVTLVREVSEEWLGWETNWTGFKRELEERNWKQGRTILSRSFS